MKAIQLVEPNKLVEREVPKPSAGPGEAVIRVKTVGICGTDVGIYRGTSPAPYPIILGHEFCGTVVEAGPNVDNVSVGDYVISEASWGCGTCYFCQRGTPSYCEKPRMYGRTCDGALAEYVKSPAGVIHRISSKIDPVEAQGATAIATALRGLKRSGLKAGQSVAVLGAGHAGAVLLQLVKMAGGSPIFVTEAIQERLDLAMSLGADYGVNVLETGWMDRIRKGTGGYGPDVVIEATGRPDAVKQAVELVKKGGTVLVFGITSGPVPEFVARDLYNKDISIVGNKGGYFEYGNAVSLMESGRVRVRDLVTRVFPLHETALAFESVVNNPRAFLRAVISVE
ncbi:MAG: zinc-dependent alcohol dehydrogenase [Ignavibacteriales bacterium]